MFEDTPCWMIRIGCTLPNEKFSSQSAVFGGMLKIGGPRSAFANSMCVMITILCVTIGWQFSAVNRSSLFPARLSKCSYSFPIINPSFGVRGVSFMDKSMLSSLPSLTTGFEIHTFLSLRM